MFVGLPVAGILYWVLARSIDVEGETRIAQAEAAELERLAHAHQRPEEDADDVAG
jgi:nucleobase:cation symporter-1, NCS1 family